jgi:hypothetical protein
MTEASYPQGMDCIWLALDQNDCIAAFVTGGSGPIPIKFLEAEHNGIEEMEERIGELPRTSTARLLISLKRPDDFIGIAERGIFAYDWSDAHRTRRDEIGAYELIAAPTNPIKARHLPRDVAAVAGSTRLDHATFQTAKTLDVRKSLNCVEGS